MNRSLQKYYLNALGMPQWSLKQVDSLNTEPVFTEPDQQEPFYLAAGLLEAAATQKHFHLACNGGAAVAEIASDKTPQSNPELAPSLGNKVGLAESQRRVELSQIESATTEMDWQNRQHFESAVSANDPGILHRDVQNKKHHSHAVLDRAEYEKRSVPVESSPSVAESKVNYSEVEDVADKAYQNSLTALENQIVTCRQCPSRASAEDSLRGQFLFQGNSHKDNNLMLLVAAPSEAEYLNGSYLLTPYQQLLLAIIKAVGLDSQNVYLSGRLKCAARDNHQTTGAEMKNCEAFFRQELDLIAPKIIVNLGPMDGQLLTTDTIEEGNGDGLSQGRLKELSVSYQSRSIPLYNTFHPSFLYRNPLFKSKALDDWIKISAHWD